jgi:glycosyltransferase involved in cell wall biosynthesis
LINEKDKNYCITGKEIPRLLVFGYPLQAPPVGGLLWSKRISDSISKLGVLDIKNVSSDRSINAKLNTNQILRNILPCLIMDFYDAMHGFLTFPQIALLDSWGEPSIFLWALLRVFQPRTRIVVVFHHYEPRVLPDHIAELKSHFARAFAMWYNSIIEKLTHMMIKEADMIVTVSRTSARQLSSFYGITSGVNETTKKQAQKNNRSLESDKIRVVGTGVDKLTVDIRAQKDIDFFCIGRIEKLDGVHNIWSAMKKLRPNVNFVMIGRASLKEINYLKSLGINHRGEVSHQEKLKLYSRSKVFLFPSIREGFGIALAESLQLGMGAVIWKLPVFEELYLKSTMAKEGMIRLVERGNYELFATAAIETLELYDKRMTVVSAQVSSSSSSYSSSTSTFTPVLSEGKQAATISVLKLAEKKDEQHISEIQRSWGDVAGKVVKALSELI